MALSRSGSWLLLRFMYFILSFASGILGKNITALLPLTAGYYGTAFDVNVTFGQGQTFLLEVDTGSADTWVLGSDWQCFQRAKNGTIFDAGRQACLTGNATFDYKAANSGFTLIQDEWLGDIYGAGDAYGAVGYEDIEVGGIQIPHQQIGVVNQSLSILDGINVGILALGYPSLSFVHPNKFKLNDTLYGNASLLEERIRYPTFFARLIEEGMEGYISMALERTAPDEQVGFGGYLGLGTLPPVHHSSFASTPVEIDKSIPVSFTNGTAQITEWLLTVKSVAFNSTDGAEQKINTPFQALVDSGTSFNLFPSKLASKINAAFKPPATPLKDGSGTYAVDCNATAPSISVELGNSTFVIDPKDMIWRDPQGRCFSNVVLSGASEAQGISLNILGSAFLKNVVAVFDMENNEFRFAQRLGNGDVATGNSTTPPTPSATHSASASPSTNADIETASAHQKALYFVSAVCGVMMAL